ncbi:MAG TPA: choice-of-anchor R domain-containing protein [Bryobacteraceae bacterium]|nr:choice-of-anchor R domain-containing protein [Bryobacteraceae bacterium]
MNRSLFALLAVLAFTARFANASVIYDTFGPDLSYNSTAGSIIGPFFPGQSSNLNQLAMAFTPSQSAQLGEIYVALGLWFGSAPVPIEISVTTDSGGLPGAAIETFQLSADLESFVAQPQPISFASIDQPLLNAGQQYWLTVTDDTSTAALTWFWSPGGSGPVAQFDNSLPGWETDGTQQGAFEIDSVPEPLPAGLLAIGAAFLALLAVLRTARPRKL